MLWGNQSSLHLVPFYATTVDPTSGIPCCEALRSGWSESCTVSSILLALQVHCEWLIALCTQLLIHMPNLKPNYTERGLHKKCYIYTEEGLLHVQVCFSWLLCVKALLSSPELDGGCICNAEAARLLQDAPHAYRQMALDCVTASLRIDGEFDSFNFSVSQCVGNWAIVVYTCTSALYWVYCGLLLASYASFGGGLGMRLGSRMLTHMQTLCQSNTRILS